MFDDKDERKPQRKEQALDCFHYFILATGYRDAECGWVMVGEESHHELDHSKSSLRTALFLVIYATKRGILEVSFFTYQLLVISI